MQATDSRRRDFTSLDATLLISASVSALRLAGYAIGPLPSRFGQIPWGSLRADPIEHHLRDAKLVKAIVSQLSVAVICFLMLNSAALFVLRPIPPRPPLRDLFRQPGLWACGIATLVIVLIIQLHFFKPVLIPTAVGVSWLILTASGRSCSEPSWLDRAGRGLGLCWLAMLPPLAWFAWTG